MSTMFEEVIDYIRSRFPNKTTISLHEPVFKGNEIAYLKECIDSTYVSYHGSFVNKFEESLKDFTGAQYCSAILNGTNAIHLSLVALGIDNTYEIITQGLSFVATANAISYTGASPIFLDINKSNLGLHIGALETFLSNNVEIREGVPINTNTGKKIGACIPVHVFGHSCSILEIVECCDKYGIPVIEDTAEALGSFNAGKHLGTFGRLGVLSFNGNKIVTTGGGGAVITNDEELAKNIFHLSTTAKLKHPWEYRHDKVGYNYRMPNVNAAIGLAQMEKIELMLGSKRKLANDYREFFESVDIEFIEEPNDTKSNYWLNAILLENLESRNRFLQNCHDHGILCRPAWDILTDLPMYKNCYSDGLENAKFIIEKLVNIPSSPII